MRTWIALAACAVFSLLGAPAWAQSAPSGYDVQPGRVDYPAPTAVGDQTYGQAYGQAYALPAGAGCAQACGGPAPEAICDPCQQQAGYTGAWAPPPYHSRYSYQSGGWTSGGYIEPCDTRMRDAYGRAADCPSELTLRDTFFAYGEGSVGPTWLGAEGGGGGGGFASAGGGASASASASARVSVGIRVGGRGGGGHWGGHDGGHGGGGHGGGCGCHH